MTCDMLVPALGANVWALYRWHILSMYTIVDVKEMLHVCQVATPKGKATDSTREIERNIEFGRRAATVHTRIAAQQQQDTGTNKVDQKVADLLTKWDLTALRLCP